MGPVLACLDFSDVTDRVLATSTELSTKLGVPLVLLHVAAPEPDFVGWGVGPATARDAVAADLRDEHRRVQELATRLHDRGVEVEPTLVRGATAETIVEQIARRHAALVVLGRHRHATLHHLLVGDVGNTVLRRSPVPVIFVPDR